MYALIQKVDNKILRISEAGGVLSTNKPFHWVECPEDCTTNWTFNGNTFSLPEVPQKTKEQLISDIEVTKNQQLESGFNYNGNLYHCDTIFQAQLNNYISLYNIEVLSETDVVPIRLKNNSTVYMNYQELIMFVKALFSYVMSIYVNSWTLKDNV